MAFLLRLFVDASITLAEKARRTVRREHFTLERPLLPDMRRNLWHGGRFTPQERLLAAVRPVDRSWPGKDEPKVERPKHRAMRSGMGPQLDQGGENALMNILLP
jgi:hypothetical protein